MRAAVLLAVLSACCPLAAEAPRAAGEALARGAAYLWARQGEDGGWHDEAYGLLKSGQSLTAFLLAGLLEVPESIAPRDADRVRRAIAFLRAHVDASGAVGLSDPVVADYPNYATALALSSFAAAGEEGASLVACLRAQQFDERLGWRRGDAAYGAWGMGGGERRPPNAGQVDLSMTRYVLEGLAAAGVRRGDEAFERAFVFLARGQGEDGGFQHSPVLPDTNKAGGARSYGTATADGVLALLAAGAEADDPRVTRARAWLVAHHGTDRVPGIPAEVAVRWDDGMRFYYLAASARAFRRLGVTEAPAGRDWRGDLAAALVACQRGDGSWKNDSFLMKEDDPLLATRFVISALADAIASR